MTAIIACSFTDLASKLGLSLPADRSKVGDLRNIIVPLGPALAGIILA